MVRKNIRICSAYHPNFGKQVRCEEPHGHSGEHYNSFYARAWSVPRWLQRATAKDLTGQIIG